MTKTSFNNAADTSTSAWQQLSIAVSNSQNPLRYLTLTSVDEHYKPQARIVVLRDVIAESRLLVFYTDIRSAKWLEIENCDALTVIGYHPELRLQLRLSGIATLHGPGCTENSTEWKKLSPTAKQDYYKPPPGEPLAKAVAKPDQLEILNTAAFGVIRFQATSLDWFEHPGNTLRRARHTYTDNKTKETSIWINP